MANPTYTLVRVFLAHHDRAGQPVRPGAVAAWRDQVCACFASGGATTYEAVGRWGGAAEPTTVVESLVSEDALADDEARLRHVLAGYAVACDQAATLYTKQPGVVAVFGGGS